FHPTGTAGGITHVHALRGSDGGKTSLTVRIKKVVITPGTPADAPGKFGGPATGAAPAMVYPPDGTLIPPNLNMLEVQFTPAAGASLFEVGFVGPALELEIYTTCAAVGGGCGLMPDDATWKLLSHASASTTMNVTLRSTDGNGGPVGGAPGGNGSNFEALSPDGMQALVNSGANLALIDTGNGMSLAAGAIMNATMPDWSADGKSVVFVRDASSSCPLGLCGSQPG